MLHNRSMKRIWHNKSLRGWVVYDWANSAYVTTVAVAVLPAYFAAAVMPRQGCELLGTRLSATSMWGYTVSLAALCVFLLAPLLGAIADYSSMKKRMLQVFCLTGGLAASTLFFIGPGAVWLTLGLFFVAQVGFVGGNVFYDAFLPHLGTSEELDSISGWGYAAGYLGGGLQFAISLGLLTLHSRLGLSADLAARLSLSMAGLWWLGFACLTFVWLQESKVPRPMPPGLDRNIGGYLRVGWHQVRENLRMLLHDRNLLLFLLAFFFYNDGIQTVISMATIYGKEELGFSTTVLMVTLLMIQVVGIFGALLFGRLAQRISARKALMAALVLWLGISLYAYYLQHPWQYVLLGALVGLILGGSQALSRSLYGVMIPKEEAATYYAFFSVINKFSSILGPLVFAVVTQLTGTARLAMPCLGVFFIIGFFGLLFLKHSPGQRL